MMVEYTGEKLGNYRLMRLLGRGGFADVYLGEHIYLQTAAAIKVLRMQLRNSWLRRAPSLVLVTPILCPCWNSALREPHHFW